MNGFTTVLLMDDPTAAVRIVAEAIAAARQVPVIDVTREARSCWGLVGENRPEEEATRLVAALKERGIESRNIPSANLPPLAGVQIVRKIEADENGFRCRMSRGETPLIPWPAPAFAAAAIINSSTYTNETKVEGPSKSEKLIRMSISMATGIPLPGGRSRTVQVRKEHTTQIGVLDIALEKPAGRLRLEADRLDSSYLGSRRTYDSMGNFKLVVADVAERVGAERLNRGARLIVAKGNLSTMGYDNLKEFEREERWITARRLLGA